MKLKAYSLLELMISIFLSGIIISAVYSGYVFSHKQFFKFSAIKTEIRSYFELSEVLNREFETAKKVIKKGSRSIEIEMIDRKINYSFDDDFIVRTLNERTDTFFFKVNDVEINSFDVNKESLIDYMVLTVKDDKQISLYKYYGAIIQIEKEDGNRY
ncbi:MAG: hypothetical protein COB15_13690 [Flavobacteriales bacterium]|nr:MAG: hypothetical protein COB15_13690 [Flavobacteriales bacterium]